MHLKISSMKRWPFCPGERWVKPLSSGGQCIADSMAAENLSLQGDKSAVVIAFTWWRHQMETFSALLAIFTGEFPAQRPGTPALMFSLIYAWINGWVNNHQAGDLRRNCAHYEVTVMVTQACIHFVQRLPRSRPAYISNIWFIEIWCLWFWNKITEAPIIYLWIQYYYSVIYFCLLATSTDIAIYSTKTSTA